MTIRAAKFTPEVMLSAPRRSAGVPNSNATAVLFSESCYSFDSHEARSAIKLLLVERNESLVVTEDKAASNALWLDDHTIALLKSGQNGQTNLYVGPIQDFEANSYVAGTIDGAADNLKVSKISAGHYGVAVSVMANPDGSMYNAETAPKLHTTGRLYRSLFVRHWDKWIQRQRQSIWYGSLCLGQSAAEVMPGRHKSYKLSGLTNALWGTALESPMPPFGGADHFDIGPRGLIFVARDPDLDPAFHTKCRVYLVSIGDFNKASTTPIVTVNILTAEGAASSPSFSADGRRAAFLLMNTDGYEADKNQLYVINDTSRPASVERFFATADGKGSWDQSPDRVYWSHDGQTLYLTAEYRGTKRLYYTPSNMRQAKDVPQEHTNAYTITGVVPLNNGSIFLTANSFIDSSIFSLINHTTRSPYISLLSSFAQGGATFGLTGSQVSDIWFPAAGSNPRTDNRVHAWVIRPSTFSPKEQYPLAFLVHGGPQGSWGNAWSTRWNPAVFAEQGYVVILPNPTGSTGYGQAFCDAIEKNWGGTPYEDLVNCFEYVDKHLDYVDCNRAVALGASYGGFMINWIQGHQLGRRFKALVTHDGVFSPAYEQATDELYFVEREFGGRFDTVPQPEAYQKWNPSAFVANWATPHLVIHSERDYRLSMADGLAVFNVLQRRGVESQLLVFPEETHFVLAPENSLRWHEAVISFINKHVGLPALGEEDLSSIIQDPERGVAPIDSSRIVMLDEE